MSTVQRKVYYDPYNPFVGFDVWDPLRDFPYGGMLVAPPPAPHLAFSNEATAHFVNPKIDWNETPEAHVFKADLPGLKGDEVKVEVEEGNIIRLSGERKVEKEEKSDKWYRVERSSCKFLRRFRLPDDARADKMKARMENGVLTVTVPKGEKKRTSKATHVS